jgi:hypothetical protein
MQEGKAGGEGALKGRETLLTACAQHRPFFSFFCLGVFVWSLLPGGVRAFTPQQTMRAHEGRDFAEENITGCFFLCS